MDALVMFVRKFKFLLLLSVLIFPAPFVYIGCESRDSWGLTYVPHYYEYPGGLQIAYFFWGRTPRPASLNKTLTLDPGSGKVTTDYNGGIDEVAAAALQPDGKVVVCGVTSVFLSANYMFALTRYNSDGSLDTTFGSGGKVTTRFFPPGGSDAQGCTSMVIQPDGKIIAAGGAASAQFTYNNWDFALARFNTDGSLDNTFGTGGLVTTDITGNIRADGAIALALQPDGKIVAAGSTGSRPSPVLVADFALARYNSDGSLDSSFGTNGKVTTDINNDADFLSSLAIQTDGKLVAGGWTYNINSHGYDFALARYSSDGTLDGSFGISGKVVTDFSNSVSGDPGDDLLTSIVLQPDGKILAAGVGEPNRGANPTSADFAIVRYTSNGNLDPTFGNGGKVATDFAGFADMANAIALQPDGKIVVAGVANGAMDNSFNGAVLLIDNRYVPPAATKASDFALARYNPDGSPDLSFGKGGRTTADFFGSIDAATKVLIRPAGDILVFGYTQTTTFVPLSGQDRPNTDIASVDFLGNVVQRCKLADFDGDCRTDISVWRPAGGVWYSTNSSNNAFTGTQFGQTGDMIVPGDYDGDGKTDQAVWRPATGTWYILGSRGGFTGVQFGLPTDLPVQGDYDGDGKTDVAVFRPSTGIWYLLQSTAGFAAIQFGQNADKPVQGDYDGDGKVDIAVFRPSDGVWYQLRSTLGFTAVQFGIAADKVVPADYDGDDRTDIAVYRDGPSGVWYLLQSTAGFSATQFGTTSDIPAPGDFDGDGRADISVFRPSSGYWFRLNSVDGSFTAMQFGQNGDKPVLAGSVPNQ